MFGSTKFKNIKPAKKFAPLRANEWTIGFSYQSNERHDDTKASLPKGFKLRMK